MQEIKPKPYWPSVLSATICCGILLLLIYNFIPFLVIPAIPFIALLFGWTIWMSRFTTTNSIQVDKISILKNRIEMTTKKGKQYWLSYENIIELKLTTMPTPRVHVDYISIKTTKGNIRLNILGERIKDGNFLNRGKYQSRNIETYYRLKNSLDKYSTK